VGGRVILTERPVYIADVLADPAIPSERRKAHLSPGGVRSYLGVPLLADGRAIGLMQIDSPEPEAWSEEERLLLMSIGPIVGAAIQNAKAYAVHAEAGRRAAALEERQGQVDQAVSGLIAQEVAAIRALVVGVGATDSADLRGRLEQVRAQIDRLSCVLGALLSPVASAELAQTLATTAPPAAPAPRAGQAAPRVLSVDVTPHAYSARG